MIQKLYEQFEEWVTLFRNKISTDPFFVARIQIMLLYLSIGTFIFMIFGWILASNTLQVVHDISIVQNGQPVEDAFAIYRHQLSQRRYIMAALFIISSYFFTEFALLPVKRARDIQKRFIATVSHELRTPLSIIKNSSEIALRNFDGLTREKAIELIRSNLDEANRLTETVQFLLTFSLLREQKKIPELQKVSLTDIAKNALPVLEKAGTDLSVRIHFSSTTEGYVKGNRIALEGMLINLVKNAISHSPTDGIVSISISESASSVQLSVIDAGTGIDKSDLPYIFEPFYRGKNEDLRQDTRQGIGLGLSIVKEVVEYHKALLSVHTNKRKGTSFIISFSK